MKKLAVIGNDPFISEIVKFTQGSKYKNLLDIASENNRGALTIDNCDEALFLSLNKLSYELMINFSNNPLIYAISDLPAPWDISWKPLLKYKESFEVSTWLSRVVACDKIFAQTEWQKYQMIKYLEKHGFKGSELEESIVSIGFPHHLLNKTANLQPAVNNKNVLLTDLFDSESNPNFFLVNFLVYFSSYHYKKDTFKFYAKMPKDDNNPSNLVAHTNLANLENLYPHDENVIIYDYFLSSKLTDTVDSEFMNNIISKKMHPIVPFYGSYVTLLNGSPGAQERFMYDYLDIKSLTETLLKVENNKCDATFYLKDHCFTINDLMIHIVGE